MTKLKNILRCHAMGMPLLRATSPRNYNTFAHCYVVVEVKTTKFEGSFLGQLSTYVSCANHLLKREGDNPTIGLLICKSKDDVYAQYSLEGYKAAWHFRL